MALQPGTRVGPYEVGVRLRSMTVSDQYSGYDTARAAHVWLDVSRSDPGRGERYRHLLADQYRLVSTLELEILPRARDLIELPEDRTAVVSDALVGETLLDRLKQLGPMRLATLHPIGVAILSALAELHSRGYLHGAIRPASIFLEDGRHPATKLRLLDLVLARALSDAGRPRDTLVVGLGSFGFAPPELIGKAKTVDARLDIYGAATLLFQALTGELPFIAKNILAMVDAKTKGEARRLSEALPGATIAMDAFFMRGLARDPRDRFASVLAMLEAWSALAPESAPADGDREATLEAAVLRAPSDVGPRLVLADLLTERGDPRGELIVVQCELQRLGCDGLRPFRSWLPPEALAEPSALEAGRLHELLSREELLVREHGEAWTAEAAGLTRRGGAVELRRGFIEHVELRTNAASTGALVELFARAPCTLSLQVFDPPELAQRRALLGALSTPRARLLEEIHPWGADEDALAILAGLEVELRRVSAGNGDPSPLARASWLQGLEGLVLVRCRGDWDALLEVACGPRRLRELQLIDIPLTREGLPPLLGRADLSELRILSLRRAGLASGDLWHLLGSGALEGLVAIDLADNPLGASDGAALARHLAAPRVLDLSRCPIGDQGLEALLDAPWLGGLRALNLEGCGLGPEAAAALARRAGELPRPCYVEVGNNPIGERGRRALFEAGLSPRTPRPRGTVRGR